MTEDVAGAERRPASGLSGDPLAAHDPHRVGPYPLLSRLGTGGMGTVYLGRGERGRLVAVKVIRPDLAADEEFRRRFRQEVAAARRVAPFCTAEVLDADPDAAAPYLVTEFIDGLRLDQAIARGGPLTPSTLTGLAVGVATALTAIHRAGLVHRDLKPSNVLLSLSGPRVIDFGIAQAVAHGSTAKPTSWGFGSAGWMAPEQINGQPIGPAADIFTWGILMAYAGTGQHPFGEGKDIDLAYRTVSAAPDLTGLVPPLRDLIDAALAKDPAARPTARDLLLALIERGHTGEPGVPPGEELLGLAADRAEVMASPAVVALTGPDPASGLPRTRVAPPGYGAATAQVEDAGRPGGPGYDPRQPSARYQRPGEAQGGIVPPRRPSTPAAGVRPGAAGYQGPARPGMPVRAGGRRGGSRLGLWLTIVLIILGALAITLIALNPGDSPGPGSSVPPSSTPTPTSTGPNSRLYTDGSLQFQIQSLRCGVQKIGIIPRKPDGQYCLVKINVRNVGTSSRTLVANQQFMYDQNGGRHEAYSALETRLYYPFDSLWNKIQPNAQVSGTLIFDIPVDTGPTRLELHDGLIGQGAQIPVEG
ncbi:protein kinase [Frankia sp. AgB1.9]|uniref:serine/threonine-protein kinase n=1 Tax=unclassified Frankia TaxID=2632575 RepID=UPI001931823A|nr:MULTISPECIES: serine/threonine-protein kinase [unclassified Frankia]MBL7489914.1 protein kinase [Frankia sp. AgW1.1]MBL7549834.1 protein kinase [Frankia sp. AgB1.9]MBL7622809.1 protein kinase [Frankia sp. AgB1.8]